MNNASYQIIISFVEKLQKTGRINSLEKVASLLQIFDNFSEANRILVLRCFIEVAKVICSKQTSLQKQQLKMKEIRSAVELIVFHYEKTSVSDASIPPLNNFLGKALTEDDAVRYFENHVEGEIDDIYGRTIIIPLDGLKHLYKDIRGNHIIQKEFFQIYRGKRLPWIRATLTSTKEIYKKRDKNWIVYAYVKCFSVPTSSGPVNNYLFVVARTENPQSPIKFVTAYYLDNHEDLLKKIEEFEPYYGPIKKDGFLFT